MIPPTVVVVHHDPAARAVLQQELTARGYHVLLVADAACAYRLICQHLPAVVVLDIDAERPDAGWQVVQSLWLNRATFQLPLVVCVAPAQWATAPAARLRAQGLLLAKPYALAEFLERVQAAARPAHAAGDPVGRRATLQDCAKGSADPERR